MLQGMPMCPWHLHTYWLKPSSRIQWGSLEMGQPERMGSRPQSTSGCQLLSWKDHDGNNQAGAKTQKSWKFAGTTHCSSRLQAWSPPQLPDCHPLPCRPCVPSPPPTPMVRLGKDIPVSCSGHAFLQISLTTIWWLLGGKSISADTFCDFYISAWL